MGKQLVIHVTFYYLLRGTLKGSSERFRNVHRKTTLLESLYIVKFLRTPILKNICKWLPLSYYKKTFLTLQ